jgi:hypothetical protein
MLHLYVNIIVTTILFRCLLFSIVFSFLVERSSTHEIMKIKFSNWTSNYICKLTEVIGLPNLIIMIKVFYAPFSNGPSTYLLFLKGFLTEDPT